MTSAADVCLSLNEVESLAAKAARGAGLGWGHAEDLGRAARWLAERGFDWAAPLLQFLDDGDAPSQAVRLTQTADRAFSASVGDRWTVDGLAPALLAPMLAAAIYGRGHGLLVAWRDQAVSLAPDGAAWFSARSIDLLPAAALTITATSGAPRLAQAAATRARPNPLPAADLDRLAVYGARTTVAATATSRARGAGSERSDND